MGALSLGQIAEQAGVRPPRSSRSTRGSGDLGRTAGIASGSATAQVPRILEPTPVGGSAPVASTVGYTTAPAAERSASAIDLYQRALRDVEGSQDDSKAQHHDSDPVRPVPRSTSTPPDGIITISSSEPALSKEQQQHHQHRHSQNSQSSNHTATPYLQPPSTASHTQSQQPTPTSRQSSGNGSEPSPGSDPSPGSHASTSIIPEHHRAAYSSSQHPNSQGPYAQSVRTPGSASHYSSSSSPSYIQHHQHHPQYAYHTQFYAPQYHYPPPAEPHQTFYTVAGHGVSPHSPVHEPQAGLSPQTFYPQAYYYTNNGQIIHTGSSSPNSATPATLDDSSMGYQSSSDNGMPSAHQGRPFSAQSSQQSFAAPIHHQHQSPAHAPQHQQFLHQQSIGRPYQLSPQPAMQSLMSFSSPHGGYAGHNQGSYDQSGAPANLYGYQQHHHHATPVSPVLNHAYAYPPPGSQRSSIDHGQHYRHVPFPMNHGAFPNSPAATPQHVRFSTTGSDFSSATPYSSLGHSTSTSPFIPQHGRVSSNGQPQPAPTELARGHLAQSKFREAVGAYDPNSKLPISSNERKPVVSGDSRLPKPPAHSQWAMWVGNVPSDATRPELWRFFSSRPPPGPPQPGSEEEQDVLESEALDDAPDQPRPDYHNVGIESIHLISRSNCCFVNMASKRHLEHAIKVGNGVSLRPHDPRCKTLLCRVRKKDDDNKTGVGAQRGKGMHQAWVAEKEKDQPPAVPTLSPSDINNPVTSPAADGDTPGTTTGSVSTTHSGSTSSTTSSFLQRHFPRRYFILKSHVEDDLHLSVERGLWTTQTHNEPVLDQAYRTSQSVYLIFGANKSGEFFGYAKMAGPIFKQEKRLSWSARASQDSSDAAGKPSSTSRKPEPSIPETPEDDSEDSRHTLSIPAQPVVLSPSGVVSNSPQPISTYNTPAPAKKEEAEVEIDYLTVRSTHQHATAPSPSVCEREAFEARKAGSLDPSILVKLHQMGLDSDNDIKANEARLNEQMLEGASSRQAVEDTEGILRKDTLLSPEERNAKLEQLEQEGEHGQQSSGSKSSATSHDSNAQGSGKPFKIEWLRVQKLPFYRTRHLRNAFNGNREVKISRDGTELEPEVGQLLLELFWKDPTAGNSQPTSPMNKTNGLLSPLLS